MQKIISVLLFAASLTTAQEGNPTKSEPCVAPGETIYQPGTDHVKPPQLVAQQKKGSASAPSRTQVDLELLLNSQGAVCEVRIVRTSSVEVAKTVADNVAHNFKFKPATRYKKPVAVKMLMHFDLHLHE
jgi:Gram-negative bacterial TonB protein C-terminal